MSYLWIPFERSNYRYTICRFHNGVGCCLNPEYWLVLPDLSLYQKRSIPGR